MENNAMKLSNQALGAIMMALQESLLNQMDIVPILKGFQLELGEGFNLQNGEEGLTIMNPPTVRFTDNSEITNQDLKNMVKD